MIGKTNAISGVSAPVPKIIKTVSGSIISISDALAMPAVSLIADINAVQSGSGDPSPSNIRPISGWSNVNVYREAQYDAGATPYATISLGGTRYGGSLDVTTGVLTVTHGIVDATTIEWTKASAQDNPNGTYYLLSNVSVPFVGWNNGGRASTKSNALVKSDTGIQATSSANTFWWNNASTGWRAIWGVANGGSTLAEFTQFLSDNNVVFYGELATPQTVQLSPTTVQMLLGNNTLWADSGDSELQYWARR